MGLSILVVAYALSPIDLVPDFIPVLGHVDDALSAVAFRWVGNRWLATARWASCWSLFCASRLRT